MGMFDEIIIDTECPVCGTVDHDVQTKDLDNVLHVYKVGDKVPTDQLRYLNCHTLCPNKECREFYNVRLHIAVDGTISGAHRIEY